MILLHNARIHTFDPALPFATALAMAGERILAVGGEELREVFSAAETEDMGERVILPGLTDAHLHLQQLALFQSIIDCETATREECLRRVSAGAAQIKPGEWLRGHGWNQNNWDGQWPTAADLEAAAPGLPVFLTAKSLHAGWASPTALRLAGIDAATPNPAHGQILRNADGSPSGVLLEAALGLIEKAIPEPAPAVLADVLRQQVFPALWRMGLTGVHDFDRRTCFQALQILDRDGALGLRVLKSIPLELLSHAADLGLGGGFGSDRLRLGPVKAFADGALGPHTAAMFAPYLDDEENRGVLMLDAEAVYQLGCRAAQAGFSLAIHAIGDRAVHEVLLGLERLREYERDQGMPPRRHRIEHVQVCQPEDARRLTALGVIASMQPIHAPSDMDAAERYIGERSAHAYSWRTQLENGAHLAFGSDAPVESPNPFLGLHAAVTRRRLDGAPGSQGWHGEQRLTVAEAFEAFTCGAAYAAGMEDRLGRLKAGFLADLILLEQDPFTCAADALHALRPQGTMIGGVWVWQN